MRSAALPALPSTLELIFADLIALGRLAGGVLGFAFFLAAVGAALILVKAVV